MVIGVLGKGGSGKSTIATLLTKHLHQQGNVVLAVDADHNMDLALNLGHNGNGPFIGGSFLTLRETFGVTGNEPTEHIFVYGAPEHRFSLDPLDTYTQKHTHELAPNLHLMMSGPQHEQVLYGQHCSHSLAAPLKIYLPLLSLAHNQWVVVDEKASVDAVSTGIPTGFDVAVVVAEPRLHSLRVADQILRLLDWYDVPAVFVLNKVTDIEAEAAAAMEITHRTIAAHFRTELSPLTHTATDTVQSLIETLAKIPHTNEIRLDRTIAKYKRNDTFASLQS
jgi:CO dehydrogenase maturation factor